MHRDRVAALVAVAVGLIIPTLACSSGSSGSSSSSPQPSAPSPTASANGSWSGDASDSSGPGQMTWQITQSGSSFSGTMTIAGRTASSTTVIGRGTVSGTVSGTAIQFAISVLAGGFDSPFASCTVTISGTGSLSSTSMTGTYSGSSSCSGAITSGQLTLNKQS